MANFPNHHRGDTWFGFTLTASDVTVPETPVAFDFTGARVVFQVRGGSTRSHPLVMELTTDPSGGMTIAGDGSSVTAASRIVDFPPGTYYTEIQCTTSAGVVLTLNNGTWEIADDVAHGA